MPPRVSSPDIRANVGAQGVVFQREREGEEEKEREREASRATGSPACICGRKNVRRVGSINQSFFVPSLWANRDRKT